jgi:hypothetical protein
MEKRGYIQDYITGKKIKNRPEEKIRQALARKLVEDYGYSKNQIVVEFPIRKGSQIVGAADIVVFRDENNKTIDNVYIIVEIKNSTVKNGIEQLKSYLAPTKADFGVWSNGMNVVYIQNLNDPPYFQEIENIPCKGQDIRSVNTKNDLMIEINDIAIPMTLTIKEQQIENLKKIARERAYEEDRDVHYTDLIREAVDEYIINYAYAAVDKEHELSSEALNVLGVTRKETEKKIDQNLNEGLVGDIINIVARKDVEDMLDFLDAADYYTRHPEEMDKKDDLMSTLPTVQGGKRLKDLVKEEENTEFHNKLNNLYERAYDSGLVKDDMQEILNALNNIKSKYSDSLSLDELITSIKEELKDHMIYKYGKNQQPENMSQVLGKLFQEATITTKDAKNLSNIDINTYVEEKWEEEKKHFEGEKKWEKFKEKNNFNENTGEFEKPENLIDDVIHEEDDQDTPEEIIEDMLKVSEEQDVANENILGDKGSVLQEDIVCKEAENNEE